MPLLCHDRARHPLSMLSRLYCPCMPSLFSGMILFLLSSNRRLTSMIFLGNKPRRPFVVIVIFFKQRQIHFVNQIIDCPFERVREQLPFQANRDNQTLRVIREFKACHNGIIMLWLYLCVNYLFVIRNFNIFDSFNICVNIE